MCEDRKLEELKMLKRFFEMVVNEDRDDNQDVGKFGTMPTFFGNVIQWNSFDIPQKAMKLIYEHNKYHIDREIFRLENILKTQDDGRL